MVKGRPTPSWDTGASHSFVSRPLAKILNKQGWIERAVTPLNGRGIKSTWRVDRAIGLSFRVGLTARVFKWEFLISDLPKPFSFLIGMDFMALHNIIVETARHCLHWKEGGGIKPAHQVVLASVPTALAIGKMEEDRLIELKRKKRVAATATPTKFFSRSTDWHFGQESGGGAYFMEGVGAGAVSDDYFEFSTCDFTKTSTASTTSAANSSSTTSTTNATNTQATTTTTNYFATTTIFKDTTMTAVTDTTTATAARNTTTGTTSAAATTTDSNISTAGIINYFITAISAFSRAAYSYCRMLCSYDHNISNFCSIYYANFILFSAIFSLFTVLYSFYSCKRDRDVVAVGEVSVGLVGMYFYYFYIGDRRGVMLLLRVDYLLRLLRLRVSNAVSMSTTGLYGFSSFTRYWTRDLTSARASMSDLAAVMAPMSDSAVVYPLGDVKPVYAETGGWSMYVTEAGRMS